MANTDYFEYVPESIQNPYSVELGDRVITYDGKLHLLGNVDISGHSKHYSFNGTEWIEESTIPYDMRSCAIAVYNNRIHIMGGQGYGCDTNHYSWGTGDSEWRQETALPTSYMDCSAAVLGEYLYCFGLGMGSSAGKVYIKFDGSTWTTFQMTNKHISPVVLTKGNNIHILGGTSSGYRHDIFNGTSFAAGPSVPANQGTAGIVYNDKIYMFYNETQYVLEGGQWKVVCSDANPDTLSGIAAVGVYDGKIQIFYGLNRYGSSIYHTPNKIIYGNRTLLDLTSDTIEKEDVVKGKTFHYKDGEMQTGTRPEYFKYYCKNFMGQMVPIYALEDYDNAVCYLGDRRLIQLRINGNNIQLFSLKTDETTESAINIVSITTAAFKPTFRIERIHFLNAMQMIIVYTYQANANYDATIRVRCITMKTDGSLIQGSELVISGTPSATVYTEAWITRGMAEQLAYLWMNTTKSTGAKTLNMKRAVLNFTSGAITVDSSNYIINISSDVDTYLNDFSVVPLSKAGFFYTNASGVDYIVIFISYSSGNYRALTLANASADMADLGVKNHYVLGMLKSGVLATYKEGEVYYWLFDPSSTTNAFTLLFSEFLEGLQDITVYDSGVITYPFCSGASVLTSYDDCITILGGDNGYGRFKEDIYYDEGDDPSEDYLPYDFYRGAAVSYFGYPYLIGGYNNENNFYTQNYRRQWVKLTDIPINFVDGGAVVFSKDNKIHIFCGTDHYSYEDEETGWIQETAVPYNFSKGSVVEYNDKIYIMGGYDDADTKKCYSWDGTTWRAETILPYEFCYGAAVVYNDKIHIFGGWSDNWAHWSYNGKRWVEESRLRNFRCFKSAAVVQNGVIKLLGGSSNPYGFCTLSLKTILAFENDVLTFSNDKRYQLNYNGARQLPDINGTYYTSYACPAQDSGPESSLWDGVFINGNN